MSRPGTRITELFGIDLPIVQAGMVWVSGHRLASACSNAGVLGVIGAGSMKPELLRDHIRATRAATQRAFGVNLPLLRRDAEDLITVCLEEGMRIIITSAGSPATWTPRLKEHGCTVVHVVSNVRQARKSEAAGCDAVVAEGFEAGGHNGMDEITTLCLVPQVVDAVTIPVIAAGGIADGRGVMAALALGAEGVQIGTLFAAAQESSAHQAFKDLIIAADDDATLLTLRGIAPVRLLRTPFAAMLAEAEGAGAGRERLLELLGHKREMQGMFNGSMEDGQFEAGQSSGLVKAIEPVADIIARLVREMEDVRDRLAS